MVRDVALDYTWTVWEEGVRTVLEGASLAHLPMPPTCWGRGGSGGGASCRVGRPSAAEIVECRAAGLIDAAVACHRVQQPSDLACEGQQPKVLIFEVGVTGSTVGTAH